MVRKNMKEVYIMGRWYEVRRRGSYKEAFLKYPPLKEKFDLVSYIGILEYFLGGLKRNGILRKLYKLVKLKNYTRMEAKVALYIFFDYFLIEIENEAHSMINLILINNQLKWSENIIGK